MVRDNLPGTLVLYGCPAEETLVGKVFMAREGLFDDADATLTRRPGGLNSLWASRAQAMNSAKFTFRGRAAHAAANPDQGRSALDAVELMNVGANYLREHVPEDTRIHYVITKGGGEPNVAPAEAQVWYYVRGAARRCVDDVYGRLLKIAQGAALMTDTSYEVELLSGCHDFLPNGALGISSSTPWPKWGRLPGPTRSWSSPAGSAARSARDRRWPFSERGVRRSSTWASI